MNSKQTCWFIICDKDLVLFKKDKTLPNNADALKISSHFLRRFDLGEDQNVAFFCAEIATNTTITQQFTLIPLKQALVIIKPQHYTMAVKSYSIIQWDKNHQFCGCCGGITIHKTTQFERICDACNISFFPRISPAIIVLITKGEHVLMARSHHFPAGVYAFIAGFVDPGESVEDTIRREVKEEVGISIKNITYFASQAWPFPDSLMLGFNAEYESGEITIDTKEIEDAGWYKYDSLPGKPSIPISIASALLQTYLARFEV